MDARIDGLPSLIMAYCVGRWLGLESTISSDAMTRLNDVLILVEKP